MRLDPRFKFLRRDDMPRMIREAMKLYGTFEYPSAANNPTIVNWANEVGGDVGWYDRDSIPWCGLFMAVVAKRAGKGVPRQSLRARAWEKFGPTKVLSGPCIGDVLVFYRGDPNGRSGHVGLYVGETKSYYYVLGGNQSDSVCITRIAKSRLLTVRREYKIGKPKTAVPNVIGFSMGQVSQNEA